MCRSVLPPRPRPSPGPGSAPITARFARRCGATPRGRCHCRIAKAASPPLRRSLRGRPAVDYGGGAGGLRLAYGDWPEWPLEVVQKETGFCHIARLPPGLSTSGYRLYEDDRPLGPPGAVHDDIRHQGGGRYSLWGQNVYFSASDNSDARRNGRNYVLKRVAADAALE